MHFQTVYDISVAGCRGAFLAPAAVALLLIAVAFPVSRTLAAYTGKRPLSRAGAAVLFGAIAFLAFVTTWVPFWTLSRDLRNGDVAEIQGLVRNFQPAANEKGIERFSVDDRQFSYGRYRVSQGFHMMAADGGPIGNGRCVRILYAGNHILRLSLARSGGSSPTAVPEAVCRSIGLPADSMTRPTGSVPDNGGSARSRIGAVDSR